MTRLRPVFLSGNHSDLPAPDTKFQFRDDREEDEEEEEEEEEEDSENDEKEEDDSGYSE